MEDKNPIKITSIIITFVIFLAGAMLCFWLYTQVINSPTTTETATAPKLEIDKTKIEKIQAPSTPAITTPSPGYGRGNPFTPYK